MEEKRIVEINGVKIEVDLRTAKRVDTYKVGDKVKVLIKKYSDHFESFPGVIVSFDEFNMLPTIIVMYMESGYDPVLKFANVNASNKDCEIAPCNEWELGVEKETIVERLNREQEKLRLQIEDIERKKNYFLKMYGIYFEKKND